MAIKGIVFSILTCFLMSASIALGAGLCANLFETTIKISTDPRDYLSKKKLLAEGLELIKYPSGEILLIDSRQAGKILGQIEVKPDEFLYQWAPLDYQQSYIENGGIDKGFLQEIINDRPQQHGKGFYVSTNPYDSSGYGNGITVFKTKSPLITIRQVRYRENSEELSAASTQVIEKLQRVNIDAIQTYRDSWLSVINHKQLVTTKKISDNPDWGLQYLNYQILTLANYKLSQLHELLPNNHIIRRVLSKKLTPSDVNLLKKIKGFRIYGSAKGVKIVDAKGDKTLPIISGQVSFAAYQESLNLVNQALAAIGEPPLDLPPLDL